MASAIPQSQPPMLETRPYFCHQCSHQWMKSASAIFQCPQCQEGFIEEVTADFQPRAPSPEPSASLFSILTMFGGPRSHQHRVVAATNSPPTNNRHPRMQVSGARGRARNDRSSSPRNRSTLSIVVGTTNGRSVPNDESNPNNNENNFSTNRGDIRIRFGVGGGSFFSIPLAVEDLMMNTLFTAAQPRPPAMTDTQLEEIEKASITAEDIAAEIQCAICFDDYSQNESDVRKLPCNHLFHEKCIFPWLKSNATCPVCRLRMPNANPEDNSDIEDELFQISRFIEFEMGDERQNIRPQQMRPPRARVLPGSSSDGVQTRMRIRTQQQAQGPSTSSSSSSSLLSSSSTSRAPRMQISRPPLTEAADLRNVRRIRRVVNEAAVPPPTFRAAHLPSTSRAAAALSEARTESPAGAIATRTRSRQNNNPQPTIAPVRRGSRIPVNVRRYFTSADPGRVTFIVDDDDDDEPPRHRRRRMVSESD